MASRNIVIKNNTRCFKSALQWSLDFSFLVVYLERRFNGVFFLRYEFEELIFGGAYTRRGLFSEFYGISRKKPVNLITLSYAAFASG